jgi:peptidoglycan/LPS O-acetylase OafA/YrhL
VGRKINSILQSIPPYQPTVAVLVAVLYLTLLPQPLGEEEIHLFEGADKVVHFIMFGGLTGTFIFDRWRIGRPLNMRQALLVALCSAALGALVEYLQFATHLGRTGNDPMDALANALGSFTAVPVCRMLHWIDIIVKRRS